MQELQQIKGTGNQGRVSKKDILNYIAERKNINNNNQNIVNQSFTDTNNIVTTNSSSVTNNEALHQDDHLHTTAVTGKLAQPEDVIITCNTEIIEMDRMRKVIAKHMIDSVQTSAHVTSFVEADVTNMVVWREKVKQLFEKREGVKLTFTPMFIECIASVMEKFPIINSSLQGDQIILKKDINIGMATALSNGNLIVPVIKGANQLSIVGLSKAVNNLATNARLNQLKPTDTQGGTFTVTNVGTFGSIMGTPIINQPQVAILALGAIKKRPVVIETPSGDAILVRHMMYLSMSYDHRIVDGAIGSQFLAAVAKAFESWDPNRQWFQYL
jgi:2-oxoglutarate dehydrogenase E2 component (dihydrolipoamide succinyltransferase)